MLVGRNWLKYANEVGSKIASVGVHGENNWAKRASSLVNLSQTIQNSYDALESGGGHGGGRGTGGGRGKGGKREF